MKNAFFIALASALITAGAITAAPAFGQTPAGEAQTHVSLVRTADLDLGSESGQRQFQRRLAQAAREVCGTASDADLAGKNDVRKCREAAVARASAQSDEVLAAARRGATLAVTATR
jgi:UrcA family protein